MTTVAAVAAVLMATTAHSGAVVVEPWTDETVADGVVGVGYTDGVSATGDGTVSYAVTAGALPAGLTLDPQTGAITGTPSAPGGFSFTVTAADDDDTSDVALTITISAAPVFTDETVALTGTVGVAYTDGVEASGSPAPTYGLAAPDTLPPGLSLNPATGAITGTPTQAGEFTFSVTATNGVGADDTAGPFTVVIDPAPDQPPVITTMDVGALVVGTPVNVTLAATGTAPITYAVTAGLLPTGLSLSTTGELTGTPAPGTEGGYAFTVTATNATGTDDQVFSGTIAEGVGAPVINASLGALTVGTPVNVDLAATGTAPITYAVTAGTLPAGLALSAEGQLTGTPTAAGAYDFTVTVTNVEGTDTQNFTGTIVAVPPDITTTSLGQLQVGQPVNLPLAATGTTPITYSVSAGALPAGLALSGAGVLTGAPTAAGAYDFTVTATNGTAPDDTQQFTGSILPAPEPLDLEGQLSPGESVANEPVISATFTNLLPGSTATLTVSSDPVVIDSDTVDGGGSVTLSGTLPADLPPGAHAVTMDGIAAAGGPVSSTGYFSVQANGTIGEVSNTQQVGDLGFVGLTPVRLVDTRDGGGQRLGTAGPLELAVRGVGGIPGDATHVAINLTATDATEAAFVTVYPCDQAQPLASNINLLPGETVANAVTSAVSADGEVCLFASGPTHVIVDVNGAYSATQGTGLLKGLSPARLLDTRETGARLTGGTPRAVDVTGVGGISGTATSVVLNVTIVGPDAGGFATVYPCGEEPPWASNINFAPSQIVANMAISKVGTNGEVCVYSSSATDLVIDVVAEFDPAHDDGHVLTTAVSRQFDSRNGDGAMVPGGTFVEIPITGAPAGTVAVALNVTSVSGVDDGYVTVYPCGVATPFTSNINFTAGQIRANSTIVPLGTDGKVCVFTTTTTHLVVDLNGAFGPVI